MISEEQKKLLDILACAWAKRPKYRLGLLISEASYVYGTGDVATSQDDDLAKALKDYVGIK